MQKEKKLVLFIGLAAIVTTILNIVVYWVESTTGEYSLGAGVYDPWFLTFTNILTVLWSFVAMFSFFLLMKKFGPKNPSGRGWLLFTLGMICWLIGDFIWMVYEGILYIESPFPSIADIIWTVGYPLMIIGVLLLLRLTKMKLPSREKILIAVIQIIIAFLAIWFIIFPIATTPIDEFFTPDQMFYSLFYPIADLILFLTALIFAFRYRGGEFGKVWIILAFGLITMAVSDLLFSYYSAVPELESWRFIVDHIYNGFYMILSTGALYLRSVIGGTLQK